MRLIAMACCAVLLVGACGDDKEDADPQIEAGGCIAENDDSVEAVSCEDEAAENVLVYRVAEDRQVDCDAGLHQFTFQQVVDGQPMGLGESWCVGTPGELTEAHRTRIDEQRAEDEDSNDP